MRVQAVIVGAVGALPLHEMAGLLKKSKKQLAWCRLGLYLTDAYYQFLWVYGNSFFFIFRLKTEMSLTPIRNYEKYDKDSPALVQRKRQKKTEVESIIE